MVKVSIVIPIYNAEKTLKKCVDSIINQTFSEIQCILVNDGSTDDSQLICEEYKKKDKRITVIQKENTGVSNSRNIGMKYASGKYVMFIDSDDYILEDYVEKLVEAAENSNADIIIGGYHIISKKMNLDEDRYIFQSKITISDSPSNLWARSLRLGLLNSTWGKLFSKDLINDIKYNEEMNYGEDTVFLINCLRKAKFIEWSNACGYYYFLGGGLSVKQDVKISEYIPRYLEELYKFTEQYFIDDNEWVDALSDKISNEILSYIVNMSRYVDTGNVCKLIDNLLINSKTKSLIKRWIKNENNKLRWLIFLPTNWLLRIYVLSKKL